MLDPSLGVRHPGEVLGTHRGLRHLGPIWKQVIPKQGDEGSGGIKAAHRNNPLCHSHLLSKGSGSLRKPTAQQTLPPPLLGTDTAPPAAQLHCPPPALCLSPAKGQLQRLSTLPPTPFPEAILGYTWNCQQLTMLYLKKSNVIWFSTSPLASVNPQLGWGPRSGGDKKNCPFGPLSLHLSDNLWLLPSLLAWECFPPLRSDLDFDVLLPLHTQNSSLTISTSHFLERPQSEPHPLSWDTTPHIPLLERSRHRSCRGERSLMAVSRLWWPRSGRTCTTFPTAGDTAEAPSRLHSAGHRLDPSSNSLQAITVRLRVGLFAKRGSWGHWEVKHPFSRVDKSSAPSQSSKTTAWVKNKNREQVKKQLSHWISYYWVWTVGNRMCGAPGENGGVWALTQGRGSFHNPGRNRVGHIRIHFWLQWSED